MPKVGGGCGQDAARLPAAPVLIQRVGQAPQLFSVLPSLVSSKVLCAESPLWSPSSPGAQTPHISPVTYLSDFHLSINRSSCHLEIPVPFHPTYISLQVQTPIPPSSKGRLLGKESAHCLHCHPHSFNPNSLPCCCRLSTMLLKLPWARASISTTLPHPAKAFLTPSF